MISPLPALNRNRYLPALSLLISNLAAGIARSPVFAYPDSKRYPSMPPRKRCLPGQCCGRQLTHHCSGCVAAAISSGFVTAATQFESNYTAVPENRHSRGPRRQSRPWPRGPTESAHARHPRRESGCQSVQRDPRTEVPVTPTPVLPIEDRLHSEGVVVERCEIALPIVNVARG